MRWEGHVACRGMEEKLIHDFGSGILTTVLHVASNPKRERERELSRKDAVNSNDCVGSTID